MTVDAYGDIDGEVKRWRDRDIERYRYIGTVSATSFLLYLYSKIINNNEPTKRRTKQNKKLGFLIFMYRTKVKQRKKTK